MSGDNVLNILQREIDENAKLFKSDTLLGLILIRGLVKTLSVQVNRNQHYFFVDTVYTMSDSTIQVVILNCPL